MVTGLSGERINEFHQLIEILKDKKQSVPGLFEGDVKKSGLSGMEYIYLEWQGQAGDSYSVYHTDIDLTLRFGDQVYRLSYRHIRPFLHPEYTRDYTKSDSNQIEIPFDHLFETSDRIRIMEFGIRPDRIYYIKLDYESYYLPPEPPDFEPSEHINPVLLIGETEFRDKPPGHLTPFFGEWNY